MSVVGPSVTFANLTLFPISSRTARAEDRLLTLDEGLAAGTVEIREIGATEVANPPGESVDPFGEPPIADKDHDTPTAGERIAQVDDP